MGVDMTATVEVCDWSDSFSPVCEVYCGRWYHWADYLTDETAPRTVSFKALRQVRDKPIHDGKVKDTDLYCIMAALAGKYGKRNVRIVWEAR